MMLRPLGPAAMSTVQPPVEPPAGADAGAAISTIPCAMVVTRAAAGATFTRSFDRQPAIDPSESPEADAEIPGPGALEDTLGCAVRETSLQRAAQMAMLRRQGRGLGEIAAQFGVSRERVRQILKAHGGPTAHEVAAARRRRAERRLRARMTTLLALWREGEESDVIAETLGLTRAACRSAIATWSTEADRAARRASLASMVQSASTYSEDDIVAAVRAVAVQLGRVPSARDYSAAAKSLDLPSLGTVHNRMDGWTNALRAAGMRPLGSRTRGRTRRWTEEACWEALRRARAELGAVPTLQAYERYAAARDDLPSPATVRKRLGRWSAIAARLAAEPVRAAA